MFYKRHHLFPLILPCLLSIMLACGEESQQEPSSKPGQATEDSSRTNGRLVIRVAGHPVRVRVSQTPDDLERGLMFTQDLPPDEGMLFVFEREKILHFWMKNTPLPLSVAFIDKKGRIVEIERMEPLDEETVHTSRQPAIYALEMNAGWFKEHGVKVGDRVEF